MRSSNRSRYVVGVISVALSAGAAVGQDDVLSVSFVGDLTQYSGPLSQNPFDPSTPLGGAIAATPDLGRVHGQLIATNCDATSPARQTSTVGPGTSSNPNVEFFLHSPILERIEARTTRLAAGNALGVPENTKILLPRTVNTTTTEEVGVTTTGFFGTGTLTVVDGVPVDFSYSQGANTLQSFDFRFNPLSLEQLELSTDSGTFTLTDTFDIAGGLAGDAPFGYNTPLSAFPGSTVLNTTRGIIEAELALGTLLNTRASSGGTPIDNPLSGTGSIFQYQAGGIVAAVTVVPTTGTASLLAVAGLAAARRRR